MHPQSQHRLTASVRDKDADVEPPTVTLARTPKSPIILYASPKHQQSTPTANRNANSGIGCVEFRAEIA